jgi:zinc protease
VGAGRTILSVNALSDNLEPAIKLLAETVLSPALKDSDISSLKEEALASLSQELSNNRRILKRIFRLALFHGTTLAFPPEGTLSGTKALTPQDVRSFLAGQLKAGDAIFAVSTNLPDAEVRGWLENAFAALPDGSAPALALPTPAPPKGRTVYVMNRKGSTTTEIGFGHLGIKADDKDRDLLETSLYPFGEDMSSRLFQELREKKGWTYGAAAGFDLFERPRRYTGGFMVWAFPQAEHTEELVLRALELYEVYVKKGLTAKELDFARKSLTNSYPFKFATSRSRLTARLYELIEGAPHHTVEEYRKILGGITRKSLHKAIKKAHDPENVAIVLVGDPDRTAGLLKSIPRLKTVVTITDPMADL